MAVITITTTLRGFQGASRSVRRLGANFRRLGQRVTQVGRTLSLRMTVPLLALGAAVLKFADTWQKAFRDIEVSTGATGKELRVLQDTLRSLAKTSTVDVGKIAQVIGSLNTLLGVTGKELEDLSRLLINVSQLMGEDAATTAGQFARALNQFQVPAEDAQAVLVRLFEITQEYGGTLSTLIGQLTEFGSVMANAGFSIEETAELQARLNKMGISWSRISPGLNAAFRKWAANADTVSKAVKKTGDESKTTAGKFFTLRDETGKIGKTFREVGAEAFTFGSSIEKAIAPAKKATVNLRKGFIDVIKAIKDAPSVVEALNIATIEFGAEGAQRIVTAARAGAFAFETLRKTAIKTADDIAKTAKESITLSEAMQKVSNNVGLVVDVIGGPLLEAFREILPHIESFAESARATLASFNELDQETKNVALAMTAIVVAGPPLIVVLGLMAGAIGALLTPVGAVVIAIVALGTAAVVFRDQINAAFDSANVIVQQFAAAILGLRTTIVTTMIEAANAIRVGFVNGFNEVKASVLNIAADIASGLQRFLGDRLRSLVNFIRRQINRIVSAWRAARRAITGGSIVPDMVNEIGQNIKKLDNSLVAATARQTGQVISNFERMQNAIAAGQQRAIRAGAAVLGGGGAIRTGGLQAGVPLSRVTAIRPRNSFQTGGSRVFSSPSLVSVAETGPERLTAEPLGGGRRGRAGNTFVFEGPVMFDELSLQKFGQVTTRVLAREDRRRVG